MNHKRNYLSKCRDPGLNQGPSDLQSDALPTELKRPGCAQQAAGRVAQWKSVGPRIQRLQVRVLPRSFAAALTVHVLSTSSSEVGAVGSAWVS